MVTGVRVGQQGTRLVKVGMLSLLWLVLVSSNVVMAKRGIAQIKNTMEDYMLPLQKCDFHFKGHSYVPPIFNLQNPGLNALSSNIITRDGKGLVSAATGDHCLFPAADAGAMAGGFAGGDQAVALEEIAAVCAEHFHMEVDRLATTALANVTDWFLKSLKGRQVVLPLKAVDIEDGTTLRAGDGDRRFPESRRCLAFLTASDITTLLDKVLNKEHRKKLSKISVSATRFRYDFNLLLNSILQFP